MSSKRDLGELGENILRVWATQRGISPTKATPDKNGWDFLLEIPPCEDKSSTCPCSSIRCIVQVKSTDRRKVSHPINLSNWLRLINWEIPAFFLVFEFDRKDNPERAFLVHLDEHHIARALTRKRQLDVENEHSYHRHSLTLRYNEAHILTPLSCDGLISSICRYVGESPESYVRGKLRLRESLGYEQGNGIARITFPPNDLKEGEIETRIADLILGLQGSLKVEGVEIFESRFGIHSLKPTHTLGSGEILIEPKPLKVELTLSGGTERSTCKADLFFHSWQGNNFKIRLKNDFLDLVRSSMDPQLCSINITVPDLEARIPMTTWREFSSLVSVFDAANHSKSEIDYEIKHRSIRVLGGKLFLKSSLSTALQELAEAVNAAWMISKHFDLHDIIQPSLEQLIGQRKKMFAFRDFLGPNSVPIGFGGQLQSSQIPAGSRVVGLFGFELILGEYRLLAAFSIPGEVMIDKDDHNRHKVNTYERQLSKSLWAKTSESTPSLSDLIHSVADSYDEDTKCIIPSWYVN